MHTFLATQFEPNFSGLPGCLELLVHPDFWWTGAGSAELRGRIRCVRVTGFDMDATNRSSPLCDTCCFALAIYIYFFFEK